VNKSKVSLIISITLLFLTVSSHGSQTALAQNVDLSGHWNLAAKITVPYPQGLNCSFGTGLGDPDILVEKSGSTLNAINPELNGTPYTFQGTVNGDFVDFTISGYAITPGTGGCTIGSRNHSATYSGKFDVTTQTIVGTVIGTAEYNFYVDQQGKPIHTPVTWTGTFTARLSSLKWLLYDDFKSGIIDPGKWSCLEEGNSVGRETQRTIVGGKLNLLERGYSYSNSNVGEAWIQQKVYLTNSPNIKAIKATVKPLNFEAVGCDNNTQPTWVVARMAGYFFNTGSVAPVNGINDVAAWIGVYRDSSLNEDEGSATIKALVRQCTDRDCITYNILYDENVGNIKKGQQAVLSLEWDKPNHRFIFMVNNKKYTYSYDTIQYPDTFGSYWKGKRLDVSSNVPNCKLTPETPRPTGLMKATFDNVYIKTFSP
jgi:hypothetical protein